MGRVLCDPRLGGLYFSELRSRLIDETGNIGQSTSSGRNDIAR